MASSLSESAVIIGTAGHIDHGKTTLVRALTGTDCDRLDEEKRRGITIVLGFASLQLPCGRVAGIVDVPGHERFVRTMVAGAGGVDIALLVVSAEEGVMPQTREHLDILALLQVPQLVVALSRSDVVDDDLLELAELDVRSLLEVSPWPEADIVPVSGVDGMGREQLLGALSSAAGRLPQRTRGSLFRLPVDRVFSVRGFGTVVTGTARDGKVAIGERLELLPGRRRVRIRGVQVHGEAHEEAFVGTRVALNLQGVDAGVVQVGSWLASPGALASGLRLDVEIQLLAGAPRPLLNNSQVRFLYGTSEVLAVVRLLERDGGAAMSELLPGELALAQLALPAELAAVAGDRFVVRSTSPMETLGGGVILDPEPPLLDRRSRPATAQLLALLATPQVSGPRKVQALLERHVGDSLDILTLRRRLPPGGPGAEELAAKVVDAGDAVVVPAERPSWTATAVVGDWVPQIVSFLGDYHQAHPLLDGALPAEVRAILSPGCSDRVLEALLPVLCQRASLERRGHRLALSSHRAQPDGEAREILEELVRRLALGGVHPPPLAEASAGLTLPPDALSFLVSQGLLVRVTEDYLVEREAYRGLVRALVERIRRSGPLSPVDFKEMTGLTRRHAIPFLEFLDRQKITRRTDSGRALRELPDWMG